MFRSFPRTRESRATSAGVRDPGSAFAGMSGTCCVVLLQVLACGILAADISLLRRAERRGLSPYSSSGGKFMSRMRRESVGAIANPKATEKAVQAARILMMITAAPSRECVATGLQDAHARRHGYYPPWRTFSKPVVTLNACQKGL